MSTQAVSFPQKRTSRYWLNLVSASLVVFYLLFVGWKWSQPVMCSSIGADYCDYWSAGTVANRYGYAQVYDARFIGPVAAFLVPGFSGYTSHPYLPVFTPAFQVLALFSPGVGFWIWTLINAAALFLYLRFFSRQVKAGPLPAQLILMVFVSLPYFMSLELGQIDVWVAIFIGEFMRAMLDHKPFRAGLWLGALVLKPQVLVILGLILLVQRSVRVLLGLTTSSAVLVLLSLLMTGPQGFINMIRSWLTFGTDTVIPWVQGMMNWRMLGFHLANVSNPWIGWGFAGAGMLATLAIMLFVWRRPLDPDSPSFAVAMVGILAAVAMLAWHSHIHLAVMLIPALVYAYQRKLLPQKIWDYWVFLPALIHLAMVFIPESLIALGILSTAATPAIHFVIGAAEFSASLYLFVWAVGASTQQPQALPNVALGGSPSH